VINLPFITADQTGPKHLEMELTRSRFEELVGPLVVSTIQPMLQALKDCDLKQRTLTGLFWWEADQIPLVQKRYRSSLAARRRIAL